jgi:hypothetical protein
MRIAMFLWSVACFGQSLSDSQIQAAIAAGQRTPAKKLWGAIKKSQQFRINRTSLLDPIERKVTFLSDGDRIALEAAEAKRQLRALTLADVRGNFRLGVVEVLLEANCYSNIYFGLLPPWGPEGGVHLVLRVGESVIQPLARANGGGDAVSILPQEHGIVSRQGNTLTYTPLYQSALYERASVRTWFEFSALPPGTEKLSVVAISGSGKQKTNEFVNPLRYQGRWCQRERSSTRDPNKSSPG